MEGDCFQLLYMKQFIQMEKRDGRSEQEYDKLHSTG